MASGKVIQVMGPSVDIQFEPETLPAIYNAIEIEMVNSRSGSRPAPTLVLEVAQHIGDPQPSQG